MKNNSKEKQSGGALVKIATFIVDKRNLFFLIFAIGLIFSVFAKNWVSVEDSLAFYLPEDSETKQAINVMDDEFFTYGTADLMISNVSLQQAIDIETMLEYMPDIAMVTFDETNKHYNNASALYNITFNYKQDSDKCKNALLDLEASLENYDYHIATEIIDEKEETIKTEMSLVIAVVAIIVIGVLALTSSNWVEVPLLLIVFLVSMILNMGTNFVFGTISFVSNSVTSVLQLALSIDYAIIFCNRYKEEHEKYDIRNACIVALKKSIPEIAASSLTTIGGLFAMIFMQYKIGQDLGMVLIKAILMSILTVFTLMPGLIMLLGKYMDKTTHKNFVPKIDFVGKYAFNTRKIIPPIFAVIILTAMFVSAKCPYVYGYTKLKPPLQNEAQYTRKLIDETFGKTNMIAVIFPSGDYSKERSMLNEINKNDEVEKCVGLPNIEAMSGYNLTDKLTPRQFSELLDMDYEQAVTVYAAYAVDDKDYAKVINGLSSYSVPLMDMLTFIHQMSEDGYLTLDSETKNDLDDAFNQITIAKNQLEGENFSRALVYLTLPQEGDETFRFIDKIHDIAHNHYGEDSTIYVAGNAPSEYDLCKSFKRDNVVVNILSILIVLTVLLFTFKSAGMPILLIMVIQGAIWTNFSIPAIFNNDIFFMCYLIVSSIQMGANIDYAILISNRYMELRETQSPKDAIINTINLSFPTIITSGSMMVMAGLLIGNMTSEEAIAGIGQSLGRGTIISLVLVMLVLPQLLILGEKIIRKTSFTIDHPIDNIDLSGVVRIDGPIYGQVNGTVKGVIHAIVEGEVKAIVDTKRVSAAKKEDNDENENKE